MNKYKILMMSKPSGDRGPAIGYKNHMTALRSSDEFLIEEIENIKDSNEFKNYDYFWFYVRFDPRIYYFLKQNFSNKKIICGPNIVFENAKNIPNDEWEAWFLNNADPDISINVAEYYNNFTKSHFKNCNRFGSLPYCYQESNDRQEQKKDIDLLFYIKKRRYDHDNYEIFNEIINELKNKNNKIIIDSVIYGSHTREEYIDKVKRSKFVVWSSIDDYCSLAQLEALCLGTPVIGTIHNCTLYKEEDLIIENVTSISEDNFVEWKDKNMVVKEYTNKIINALNLDFNEIKKNVDIIFKENYSHEAYRRNIKKVLSNV